MRLIDADAFANFIKNVIKTDKYDSLKINDTTLTVAEVLECVVAELEGTSAQLIQCKECVYGNKMKDTIRCELMDYLPVECDHFCSWAERVIDE